MVSWQDHFPLWSLFFSHFPLTTMVVWGHSLVGVLLVLSAAYLLVKDSPSDLTLSRLASFGFLSFLFYFLHFLGIIGVILLWLSILLRESHHGYWAPSRSWLHRAGLWGFVLFFPLLLAMIYHSLALSLPINRLQPQIYFWSPLRYFCHLFPYSIWVELFLLWMFCIVVFYRVPNRSPTFFTVEPMGRAFARLSSHVPLGFFVFYLLRFTRIYWKNLL